MDSTATDDEPKAEITRCICGHDELQPGQIHNLHRQRKNFDPDFFIQCDSCHVWQHGYCVGILNDQEAPEGYYCEKCRPDYHVIVVRPSGRTSKYSPQEYSDEEEEDESKAPLPKEKEFSREERASRQRKEKDVILQEPDQDESSRTANSNSSSSRRDRKRRLTVNSTRDEAAYEETLRRVLEESVHDDEHRDAKAALESIKGEAASVTTALVPPASSTSSSRNKKRRTDSPSGSDESARTSASSSKRATKTSNGTSNNNGNNRQISTTTGTAPSSLKGAATPALPASQSPLAAASKKSEKRKRRHNASDDHSSRATSHLHSSSTSATTSASGKSYIDKPSKPRIPQSRISIPEMQKRVAAILEFIARTRLDLDIEERERRQLLDIRLVRYKQLYKPEPTEGSGANGTTTSNSIDPEQDRHLNDPKFGSLVNGFSKSLTLMDTLTAKLSDWEQRYGAYGK